MQKLLKGFGWNFAHTFLMIAHSNLNKTGMHRFAWISIIMHNLCVFKPLSILIMKSYWCRGNSLHSRLLPIEQEHTQTFHPLFNGYMQLNISIRPRVESFVFLRLRPGLIFFPSTQEQKDSQSENSHKKSNICIRYQKKILCLITLI